MVIGGYVFGALLFWGALAGALGVFVFGGADADPDIVQEPDGGTIQGDAGEGILSGWGGNDEITRTANASGFGGEGDDVLSFLSRSEGDGGAGDDVLIVIGGGEVRHRAGACACFCTG